MNKAHGFTLLEVLVVIAIIAVLIAFAASNFVGARQRARDIRKKSELQQVKSALRLFYNDYNMYPGPATKATNDINGCGAASPTVPSTSCQSACSSGEDVTFAAGPTSCDTVYMKQLPPASDYTWYYQQRSLGDDFCLWTKLEITSDPEIAKSEAKCSSVCNGVIDAGSYVTCAD